MTEARPTRLRDHLGELVVNSLRIVGAGETEALGHAEDVSVDGDRGLVERVAEHDVGSLQSDTGECDERITGSGNLAPVAIDKRLRHPEHRLRLRAEEAGRLDLALEALRRRRHVVGGPTVSLEQRRRHDVHAFVGALRGEDGRDEQLERRREVQRTLRVRICLLERRDDRARTLALCIHRLAHRSLLCICDGHGTSRSKQQLTATGRQGPSNS